MSVLKMSKKSYRVLRFIAGARHPRVLRYLKPFGFTLSTLAEGVRLFQLTALLLAKGRSQKPGTPTGVFERMDGFENRWYPVVRATLARHYPGLSELFFENLGQSQGMGTTFGLVTFIARLQALKNGDEPFGAEGPRARQLLEERGITEAIEAEGQDLIDQLAAEAPGSPEPDVAAEEAEAELWAWYREWSAIAQVAIKDKTLLRSLGYLRKQRGGSLDEEVDGETEEAGEEDETIVGELVESSALAQLSTHSAETEPSAPQLGSVDTEEEDTAAE